MIFDYNTFRKIINIFTKKEAVRSAIEFLWFIFLRFFDFMPIYNFEEKKLAEFLITEKMMKWKRIILEYYLFL